MDVERFLTPTSRLLNVHASVYTTRKHMSQHYETNDKFVPLVNRIRMLLAYMSEEDVARKLVGEGQSPADVWLCVMAARILDK